MKTDNQILDEFNKLSPWGLCCSIDLKNCNPEIIRDAEKIKEYVITLCDLIKMKRFGSVNVVNFGEDPRVSGFSMTQLIETSLISGHFVDQVNGAFLDIFSCKYYPPYQAAEFSKQFFEASEMTITINFRV